MIAYILNRYATTQGNNLVKCIIEIDSYTRVFDYDYKGNSTVITPDKPWALRGDFIVVVERQSPELLELANGDLLIGEESTDTYLITSSIKDIAFSGIIDKISESDKKYSITVNELCSFFDEDIFAKEWGLAASSGIEDYFVRNMEIYYRNNRFSKFNNDYISFYVGSHTPYGGAISTSNGIVNLRDQLSTFLKNYHIYADWSIGENGLSCTVGKIYPSVLTLNLSYPYVANYTDEYTNDVLSCLYVVWHDTVYNTDHEYTYVMDTNGKIRELSEAYSRLEGYAGSLYVSCETWNEMYVKVQEKFSSNKYKHKLKILMRDGQGISRGIMKPGQSVSVVLKDGTIENTIVNKVTIPSNSEYYTVELGNLDITLTDKLRRLF